VGHLQADHPRLKAVHIDGSKQAEQVHITLGGPNEVVVTFATADYRAPSVVHYGTDEAALSATATGEKRTYTQRYCPEQFQRHPVMPGSYRVVPSREETIRAQNSSAWLPPESESYKNIVSEGDLAPFCWPYLNDRSYYESPTIHHVRLQDLTPSTTYYYACGSEKTRTFSFTTPPPVGPDVPLRVGLWADVGQSNVSLLNADSLRQYKADINLLAGDVSYADGTPWRWDTWSRAMEPMLSENLQLYCPGNHDMASGAEHGISYLARFPSPWQSSGSSSPLWYSIDIGPMHLISLAGTYSPIHPGTAQYEWLMDDLAAVDRTLTPWLVVMWHTPWYNSNGHHQLEAEPMREVLEEVLVAARVNLVISGHVHSYERTKPVRNFAPDECGPVYVVVGDGGNYEGPALPWGETQPSWSAFREASFGTATLEIANATTAVWRWRRHACVQHKDGLFDVWSHEDGATYYVSTGTSDSGCATEDDNSGSASVAVDEAAIRQHPPHCAAATPASATSRR